ncbi:unnamed protein product, partial [Prorocentrum cordatum]
LVRWAGPHRGFATLPPVAADPRHLYGYTIVRLRKKAAPAPARRPRVAAPAAPAPAAAKAGRKAAAAKEPAPAPAPAAKAGRKAAAAKEPAPAPAAKARRKAAAAEEPAPAPAAKARRKAAAAEEPAPAPAAKAGRKKAAAAKEPAPAPAAKARRKAAAAEEPAPAPAAKARRKAAAAEEPAPAPAAKAGRKKAAAAKEPAPAPAAKARRKVAAAEEPAPAAPAPAPDAKAGHGAPAAKAPAQALAPQARAAAPAPAPAPAEEVDGSEPVEEEGGDDESEGFSILEGLSALEDEEAQEERDAVDDDLGVELTGWPEGGSVVDRVRSEAEKIRLEHSEALQQGRRKGHETVLLHASMQFLFPSYLRNPDGRFNGTYVDLTFGRGGHSREILRRLSPHGRLVAFDVDHTAQVHGLALAAQDPRFTFVMRPFAEVAEVMRGTVVHGVMLDIGVSNPQLDDYSRGFSMNHLGRRTLPFDLRMNPRGGVSASEWLAGVTVEELAWVFREYAGTRVNDNPDDGNLVAERMAQAIIDEQEANGPYKTINRFAEVVGKLILVARGDLKDTEGFEHTARGKEHPAKMWVAAIRTFLNDEAMQLEAVLPAAMESLAVGGRCLIAVFKPGEAEAVRQFALAHAEPPPSEAARLTGRRLRELYPLAGTSADFSCQLVVRGLRPSGQEVTVNNRARSGALWVLEKAARTLPRVKARPRPAKSRFKMPPRPLLGDGLPDRPDLQLF